MLKHWISVFGLSSLDSKAIARSTVQRSKQLQRKYQSAVFSLFVCCRLGYYLFVQFCILFCFDTQTEQCIGNQSTSSNRIWDGVECVAWLLIVAMKSLSFHAFSLHFFPRLHCKISQPDRSIYQPVNITRRKTFSYELTINTKLLRIH